MKKTVISLGVLVGVLAVVQSGRTEGPPGEASPKEDSASPRREITLPRETATFVESNLPGYQLARQKCGICHSADYIAYQPPGKSLNDWTGEVRKMRDKYGAPLSDTDITQIGAYLAVAYGSADAQDPAVLAAGLSQER